MLSSVLRRKFLLCIPCWLLFLNLFLSGEFLLFIPCWFNFYRRSFSYTSRAGFIFMRGVFLTHPLLFFVVVVVFVIWGFSLTHLMLVSFFLLFLSGEFLLQLHIPCCFFFYRWCFSYTAHAGFFFIWGVSLTHPIQFLLLLLLFLKGFSYTSRAEFFFMWGASLVCTLL